MPQKLNIYILYSPLDENYFRDFAAELAKLIPAGKVGNVFTNNCIWPLSKKEAEWFDHTDIFIFLLSEYSLSNEAFNNIIKAAVKKEKEKDLPVTIISLLLRPCDWSHLPLAAYKFLPDSKGSSFSEGYESAGAGAFEPFIASIERNDIDYYRPGPEVLIKREQIRKSGYLNLSGLELNSLPASVMAMNWLRELDISNNNFTKAPNILGFQKLETLDLSDNKISFLGDLFYPVGRIPLFQKEYSESFPALAFLNKGNAAPASKNSSTDVSELDLKDITQDSPVFSSLHTLKADNNTIISLGFIRNFKNLKTLCVAHNKLTLCDEIGSLKKLEWLDLSVNKLTALETPFVFSSLFVLKLRRTGIEPQTLFGTCEKLKELDISSNQYTVVPPLQNFPALEVLHLAYNKLTRIHGLENLQALKHLRLDYNFIKQINHLGDIKSLEVLSINHNEIASLEGLEKISGLRTLSLAGNLLTKLENINHLKEIEELNFSENEIAEMDPPEGLENLKTLNLSNNKITDVLPLKDVITRGLQVNEYGSKGLQVRQNPIQNLPDEVLKLGQPAIIRYLDQLEKAQQEKLLHYQSTEIKLILIGNPNVGKTHVGHFIKTNGQELPPHNASTHGMMSHIINYQLPGADGKGSVNVKMRILDFGGQEYYHDTHHLFFTNDTIYLLLWDKETNKFGTKTEKRYNPKTQKFDDENNAIFPLAYWLDAVNYFVNRKEDERRMDLSEKQRTDPESDKKQIDPLLILVETKRNKKGAELFNTQDLQPFKSIVHSQVAISLYKDETGRIITTGISALYDSLNNLISSIFTKTWSGYYELMILFFESLDAAPNQKLLQKANADKLIISLSESRDLFNLIIKQHKRKYVFDRDNALDLCRYLANRGYILYFDETRICFTPDELTKQIYRVLTKEYNNQGIITQNDAEKHAPVVISIMQDFKLLIPHPSGNGFIAPQLLPESINHQLTMFMEAFKPAVMRFAITGYIHKNILQELFFAFREQLLKEETQNYIWRNGFVIKVSGDLYKINISSSDECRHISIQYLHHPNYKVLNDLSKTITSLLAGRSFSKEISTDGNLFIPADLIRKSLTLSQIVFNDRLIRIADYSNFLDESDRKFSLKKLFISYSSKNTSFMRRLETHLAPLKRNGDIDFWHDRMIEPGTSWDNTIRKEMETSDIIVFLLSPDFIATNYIFEVEIPKALELYGNKTKLFFIELQPCNWEKTVLANYQQTIDPNADNKGVISIGLPDNDAQWKKAIAALEKILH